MNDSVENLRRHLRIARQALLSDEAFQAALDAEREREFEETRADQARIVSRLIALASGDCRDA
jgi:hypothetical protein